MHVDARNAPFRGRFHGDRAKLRVLPPLAAVPAASPPLGVSLGAPPPLAGWPRPGLRWGDPVPGLRLPGNALLGGLCADVDVRFLQDREDSCSRPISAQLCNADLGAQR
jgi:hypothetical protein